MYIKLILLKENQRKENIWSKVHNMHVGKVVITNSTTVQKLCGESIDSLSWLSYSDPGFLAPLSQTRWADLYEISYAASGQSGDENLFK